jgi:hypothetical protein
MARITTFVTLIIVMTLTTLAFGGQQSAARQITLSIGSFTISADQLTYDSDFGVIKASGNVTLDVKGHLKLSTPDTVEVKIDRTAQRADGAVYGRVSGEITATDGTVRVVNTAAPPEGRPALKFSDKF